MRLTDLLARFDGVVEERDGWLASCPAHSDSHQSLRIAVGDTGAALLRCRAGCDTSMVLQSSGLTFNDLRSVEDADGVVRATSRDVPADPEAVAALAVTLAGYESVLDAACLAYAAERFGVDGDAAARLGLGSTSTLGGGLRLVVPFRDPQGVARGYQARALEPNAKVRWMGPASPPGGSWARLGWFSGGTDWPQVFICEGPGDALTAAAAGYDAIAVRGAALAGNESVVAEIVRWLGDRPAVVAGDADRAGDEFSARLVTAITLAGGSAQSLRPEAGDLSSWYESNPAGFQAALSAAVDALAGQSVTAAAARAWTDADLTDVAAARRLLSFFEERGSGVRFSPETGFLLLRDGVWEFDRLDRVRTQAQAAASRLWEAVKDLAALRDTLQDPDEIRQVQALLAKVTGAARHANSRRGLDSCLRELQALPHVAVEIEDFDRHEHLLAVRNGVIDLRTGTLMDHDPSLLITRRINLEFDPEAAAPRWERFLEEVFPGHPDLPAYMRRLIGYGITGSTAEQMFAVLWGTGSNGKSIFTETLSDVFEAVSVTTPFSTFEERQSGGIPNDLAALKGARLVYASEGEQNKPMAEAILKRVTGRDKIAARFLRREFFEFRPSFLLMLATNYRPVMRGADEGLWRRVRLIPFERYFAPHERDYRLASTLLSEAEGILAWAVRGAIEWYADGLLDPPVVLGTTKEYRETSDALMGFLPGVFVADAAAERVQGSTLFTAYLDWCQEENLPNYEVWTRRRFFSALEERGYVKRKGMHGVEFTGIRRAKPGELAEVVPLNEKPKVEVPVAGAPSLFNIGGS
jgi:putative DNA primase/helicase